MRRKSTRWKYAVLCQLCQLIPACLVPRIAREHGVDKRSRTFSPWSHVVALLYAQLAHCVSLHDVCDGLRHHEGKLWAIRGATSPAKNTLSHANRNRDAKMAEDLFWQTFNHLASLRPGFTKGSRVYMPRRFTRVVRAIDATTIRLVADCMDWAKHRRRKAAAKLHLSLNLQCFLPSFVVVDAARHQDCTRAPALCANMKPGEIALFDKAYVDFALLADLSEREIFWVTRPKENLSFRCVRKLQVPRGGNILSDKVVALTGCVSKDKYFGKVRIIHALVEVDSEMREMTFMTNNMEWAASSICELYKSRWSIEVFFKEIKQTLQLCDFLGHNKNAISWQIWTALLLYVLLRFMAFIHSWEMGFKRLFCVIRSCIWDSVKIESILGFCGTARGHPSMSAAPQQAYLPGFEPEVRRGHRLLWDSK